MPEGEPGVRADPSGVHTAPLGQSPALAPIGTNLQLAPEPGPDPALARPHIAGFTAPVVGQPIHFWPHRGHHPEWYFEPHAAIVIKVHPTDPRIVNLYYFGPKGEVGSYGDIPHISLRPECEPTSAWRGRAMPPSTHWTFVDES